MDYTSYVYIIIAIAPFIVWGMVIFALSNDALSVKNGRSDNINDNEQEDTHGISFIPYGLVFPLYYRSSGQQSFMG